MSDTHRRYRSINQALRQIIRVRPNSHADKHLNTLTALICGLVGSQHSHLPKIARHTPAFGAKPASRIERFERFLKHDGVTYEVYYLPFAQAVLAALAHQPLVLIIDGSMVGRGGLALMISVVYQGRALPLIWTVVKGKKGHFPQSAHCDLVAQLQALMPADATVIFVGDGEFDGVDLQAQLQSYRWHYVCRTAANTLIWGGDCAVYLSDFPLSRDEALMVQAVRMTEAQYGPIQALAVWEVAYPAPIYLVTNLSDPEAAPRWYRQRPHIETFFSDQESRGFHMDKSHLSDPQRLARLLLAACLAYLWIVYLGALAQQNGMVRYLHRTDRCDLGLFQLGLSYLAHCLNEELPIPIAFRPPPDDVLLSAA